MILSTLDLSPNGFLFRLFPQKSSYQLIIIHAYILISLPIPNRYGTLWDFEHTPNNPPIEQSSTKPPIKPGFSLSFTMFEYTPYVTPAGSQSDPIGGSEPKSGVRDYLYHILYTGTLINLFLLRAVPLPVGIQTISVITKIIFTYTKELPPEWCPSQSIHIYRVPFTYTCTISITKHQRLRKQRW